MGIGEDDVWRREPREDDCPCRTDWPHERNLASLYIVEHFLAEPAEFDE